MADVSSQIVEVCIFKTVQNSPRYLLLQRAADEPLYPGIWQIVTGMLEDKEDAVSAALRELKEETDLTPQRLWVAPYVDLFYTASNDSVNLSPLFVVQVNETDEPTLSNEHQAYGWFELEKAGSLLIWPGQKQGLKIVHEYTVGGLQGGKLTEIKDFINHKRNHA